jgi:type I restriction enzyme M protein
MTAETHTQLADFIWSICNLLRGPYKRNEYRKVILPLTVLRRFDNLLAPTKAQVLAEHPRIKGKPDTVVRSLLENVTKRPFYNLSKLDLPKLLDDPNQLAPNLNAYISGFSKNVRDIMERFAFDQQIARMAEKNLLYEVIKAFCDPKIDLTFPGLTPAQANVQMGYVFEELIRIGAEQSNEEAGEHFTPREVIKLMVNLLLSPEQDLRKSHVVKTIYDPACGTGGMLSVAERYIRDLNADADPHLFGQDWNDESWAICKADMLIKGEDADNIVLGDSFTKDGFDRDFDGKKRAFDYMLANPPFGVEWKQQQKYIEHEAESLGYNGRFGAGLPRINDGSLLFLQHMLAKMRARTEGGSRIGIVFNGSPLFTGDAGSGESNIRQWIIENDWLEAVVALPDQLFYNTGISTHGVWRFRGTIFRLQIESSWGKNVPFVIDDHESGAKTNRRVHQNSCIAQCLDSRKTPETHPEYPFIKVEADGDEVRPDSLCHVRDRVRRLLLNARCCIADRKLRGADVRGDGRRIQRAEKRRGHSAASISRSSLGADASAIRDSSRRCRVASAAATLASSRS